jgi:hypothetical protein
MKTVTVWLKHLDGDDDKEYAFVLPNPHLEEAFKEQNFTQNTDVTKLSENVYLFGVRGLDNVIVLNEILKYIQRKGDDQLWEAFIAIQESTGFDPIESYKVLVDEKYEFFLDFEDMASLAEFLVKERRVFTRVPKDVIPFLDYEKIGDNLLHNGHYYLTTTGIMWLNPGE